MNKFFRVIKSMPDKIANMNRYCLQKFKEDPNLIPDGNTDSTVSAINLDWFIGINPEQYLLKTFGAKQFSWISLAHDDEPPVLSGTSPSKLVNNFAFPFVLVLDWTGINAKGEEVFLDVSGATRYQQVLPFTPSTKNDIRRLFSVAKDSFKEQELQKGEHYHAKFIPQLNLLNEDWDTFFVNEDKDELSVELMYFTLFNDTPYDDIAAFARKKYNAYNKIFFDLAYNNHRECVDLNNFHELRLTPTFSWIFTR